MAYWIYGLHAVQAAFNNPARQCLQLAILPNINLNVPHDVKKLTVDKGFFDQKFGHQAVHQGVALQIESLDITADIKYFVKNCIKNHENSLIVILDQVTDPHNMGAIVRVAATMNVTAIIVPRHQSVNLTSPVLYKIASGAMEHVPMFEAINLSQTLQVMKEHGYWIMGLDETGTESINKMDLTGHYGLILGAEGKGMRRLIQESCDYIVKLPTSKRFSTLNVAQAGAIAFYAFHLQHFEK